MTIASSAGLYETNLGAVPMTGVEPCALCRDTRITVIADGIRDYEYGAPGTYRWLRCDQCGIVRIDPMPGDDILSLAYPDTYHAYQPHRSRFVSWYVRRRLQARAKELAGLMPAGGTILDVGCGTGSLFHEMKRLGPYRMLGVEYRADAAEQARQHGTFIWTGELEDAELPDHSVDLCVMEHVIEHVRNPVDTLRKIRSKLKPGGVLVGETPNLHCFDAKLFGRYWGGGHAPRHLWLFQPDSLSRTLRECGYSSVLITHPVYSAHMALSVQNWLRRFRTDTAGLTCGRSWYFPLLCSAAMVPATAAALIKQSGAIRFTARSTDE